MSDISFIKPNRGGNLVRYQNFLSRIERKREMLLSGSATAPNMKAKYKKINEKLISLKNKFRTNNITLMSYVDAVGHFLHLEN